MNYDYLKNAVLKANLDLVKHNLVVFTWGNASAIDRQSKLVAIKPSGVAYENLKTDDIVIIDLLGNVVEGKLRPSSDTLTHLEIYKAFPEVQSIVHTHSTYATAYAQANKEIKCLGTTHADYFYGDIPLTRQLTVKEMEEYEINTGKIIVEKFKEDNLNPVFMPGCLVRNHGVFAWGNKLDNAVHNATIIEELAKMNFITETLEAQPKNLPHHILDKHYQRKHGPKAYYGQK